MHIFVRRGIVQDVCKIQQFIVFMPRTKHLLFIFFTFALCGSLVATSLYSTLFDSDFHSNSLVSSSYHPLSLALFSLSLSPRVCMRRLLFHFSTAQVIKIPENKKSDDSSPQICKRACSYFNRFGLRFVCMFAYAVYGNFHFSLFILGE